VTVIDKCGQVTKVAWWSLGIEKATKDVVACDMLRKLATSVDPEDLRMRKLGWGYSQSLAA